MIPLQVKFILAMRARVFSSPNSQTKPTTTNRLTAVVDVDGHRKPKLKKQAKQPENGCFESLDENLLFDILKLRNARTLSAATCVNKQWHRVAEDERLWELIYKQDWTGLTSEKILLSGSNSSSVNTAAVSSGFIPIPCSVG